MFWLKNTDQEWQKAEQKISGKESHRSTWKQMASSTGTRQKKEALK